MLIELRDTDGFLGRAGCCLLKDGRAAVMERGIAETKAGEDILEMLGLGSGYKMVVECERTGWKIGFREVSEAVDKIETDGSWQGYRIYKGDEIV